MGQIHLCAGLKPDLISLFSTRCFLSNEYNYVFIILKIFNIFFWYLKMHIMPSIEVSVWSKRTVYYKF